MRQENRVLYYFPLILFLVGLFSFTAIFIRQGRVPAQDGMAEGSVPGQQELYASGKELLERRTPYSRHFLNMDGSITVLFSSAPYTYQDSPPAPRPSDETTPSVTYRGYSYWHNNDGYFKYSATDMKIGHDFDLWNEEYRGWTEWNISSVPDTVLVTYVGIQLVVNGKPAECDYQRAQVCMYEMANRPSLTSDATTLFNDAGDGTQYRYAQSYLMDVDGTYSFLKLGSNAVNDLTNQRSVDWFAVGFIDYFDGGTGSSDDEGLTFTSATLKVIYYPAGDDDSYEENDDLGTAKYLLLGTYSSLKCFDADWYNLTYIVMTYGQSINLRVTCQAQYGDLQIKLYNSGTEVCSNATGNDIILSFCVSQGRTGNYSFQVLGVNGEMNTYSLTILDSTPCDLMRVINPIPSMTIMRGNTLNVTWSASSGITRVMISLYNYSQFCCYIVSDYANLGYYLWTVSSDLSVGDHYTIRIQDLYYPDTWASSEEFSITGGGPINWQSVIMTIGISVAVFFGICVVIFALKDVHFGGGGGKSWKSSAKLIKQESENMPLPSPIETMSQNSGTVFLPSDTFGAHLNLKEEGLTDTPSQEPPDTFANPSSITNHEHVLIPRLCQHCGADLQPEDTFCDHCGLSIL